MPSAYCCQESRLLGLHVVGTSCGTVRAVPGASGLPRGPSSTSIPAQGPCSVPSTHWGWGPSQHTPDLAVPDSALPWSPWPSLLVRADSTHPPDSGWSGDTQAPEASHTASDPLQEADCSLSHLCWIEVGLPQLQAQVRRATSQG